MPDNRPVRPVEPDLSRRTLAVLRRRLLVWYGRHHRDLPWRHDRDPYRIWVSEIMLQQTQVSTVMRFFEPFLQAFPTPAALAAADEREVLRRWEGLGYYRRARDLHQAVGRMVAAHGDRLPDDPEAWRDLPGVGRYTRGAILSQAFDHRLPILEANSERVLCRLFGETEDPRRGAVRRRLWEYAEALLPRRGVGEFNQALMELGALVCTPAAPACPACPLAADCVARKLGRQHEIPARGPGPETVEVREVAVVLRRGGRVLLAQRPQYGRWANLWEFPHGEVGKRETYEAAAGRLVPELTGLRAALGRELLTVRHRVTRFAITLKGFEARPGAGRFRSSFYRRGLWLRPEELHDYPVSVPQRRLARVVIEQQK